MGITTFTAEVTSPVAPARLFTALVLDSHTLAPKLLPSTTKSVEVVPARDGTIVSITFVDGNSTKHKFTLLDRENFHVKYALIEGGELGDKIESIVFDIKIDAAADGSSSSFKRTVEVHPVGEAVVTEADLKVSNERAEQLYKAVEKYLLENPAAYA